MKVLARSLALVLAVVASSDRSQAATQQGNVTIDLGRGPVTVHVPSGYDPAEPAPLVMLLHGYCVGCSGQGHENYMQFGALQDQYGFLYVYPDGTLDSCGARFWNATNACCGAASGVDDSGYLRALIDEIAVQLSVDPRRVYLIGHSNGGFMAYRMACDHADVIAAIVSLAGATQDNPAACTPSEPVHVLQIHGTADAVVLYNGGAFPPFCSSSGGTYPGAAGSVSRWLAYSGCQPAGQPLPTALDLDACVAGAETTVTRWSSCDTGGSGELWSIQGGGHNPCLTQEFRTRVLDYLFAHAKPGIDPIGYCSPAQPNSSGVPASVDAAGSDVIVDNDLTLLANDVPLGQFGYFLNSMTQGSIAPPGSQGILCLGGAIGRHNQPGLVQPGPSFSITLDLTSVPTPSALVAVQPGETWNFQAWYRDVGGTNNFTDGVSVTFQ